MKWWCAVLVLVLAASGAASAGDSIWSKDELTALRSHGPWPPRQVPDASNRLSGNPSAIRFGKALFFDKRFSARSDTACATCHAAERALTDGQPRSRAIDLVDRNAISLINVRFNRWFGWDGRSDSLWAHSIHPLLDAKEMGMTFASIRRIIANDDGMSRAYESLFARAIDQEAPERLLANLGKSLAAYQETLISPRSAFDLFRQELLQTGRAPQTYSQNAIRGFKLFVGKAQCSVCHSGARFTNGEFHDIGLPHFAAQARVDAGRYDGIRQLLMSPYNVLGPHNDDPSRASGSLTKHVALQPRNWGEFRVPSLRGVAATAPYMHDGGMASLHDVVRYYSAPNVDRLHSDGERLIKPLMLSEEEIDDLIAFLTTL